MLDDEYFHRNEVLSSLLEKGVISSAQKIEYINFFIGWNIDFAYDNKEFQWNTDNKIHMYDENHQDLCPPFETSHESIEDLKTEIKKWLENLNKQKDAANPDG